MQESTSRVSKSQAPAYYDSMFITSTGDEEAAKDGLCFENGGANEDFV